MDHGALAEGEEREFLVENGAFTLDQLIRGALTSSAVGKQVHQRGTVATNRGWYFIGMT